MRNSGLGTGFDSITVADATPLSQLLHNLKLLLSSSGGGNDSLKSSSVSAVFSGSFKGSSGRGKRRSDARPMDWSSGRGTGSAGTKDRASVATSSGGKGRGETPDSGPSLGQLKLIFREQHVARLVIRLFQVAIAQEVSNCCCCGVRCSCSEPALILRTCQCGC